MQNSYASSAVQSGPYATDTVLRGIVSMYKSPVAVIKSSGTFYPHNFKLQNINDGREISCQIFSKSADIGMVNGKTIRVKVTKFDAKFGDYSVTMVEENKTPIVRITDADYDRLTKVVIEQSVLIEKYRTKVEENPGMETVYASPNTDDIMDCIDRMMTLSMSNITRSEVVLNTWLYYLPIAVKRFENFFFQDVIDVVELCVRLCQQHEKFIHHFKSNI